MDGINGLQQPQKGWRPLKFLSLICGTCLAVVGVAESIVTNKYRDIKEKKELKMLGTFSVTKDAEIKKIS